MISIVNDNRKQTNKIIIITIFGFCFCLVFIYYLNNSQINFTNYLLNRKNNSHNLNVFIDLGTNSGDSIYNFLDIKNDGVKVTQINQNSFPESFKHSKWIIYAFEANKYFNSRLDEMKRQVEKLDHRVYLYKQTAAWTFDGTIDFYLDTVNEAYDYWGSSLKQDHRGLLFVLYDCFFPINLIFYLINYLDVLASNKTKVNVKCMDIARIINTYKQTDNIIVKMDIEGSEYDLIQHFIVKDAMKRIDYMAVEFHNFVSPFNRPEDVLYSLIKLFGVKFLSWN
jgi:FkbM family methyltransferase